MLPGPVSLDLATILSGNGTVAGPLSVTSSLGATVIPDILNTGNFADNSFLNIHIDGTAPGVGYGTMNVTGTVDITGAGLVLFGSYLPAAGDVFTIITNDGGDPVAGTFATLELRDTVPSTIVSGLPEGATFPFNGSTLRISYVGGTGNDVTLTALGPVTPAVIPQVPTLSQWALVLLAAMMLAIGMLARARRR